MQPQAFYRVVADDFTAVDGIIRQQVVSRVPLVEKIGDYIISAGGKRLRPLLVLLSGRALGYQADDLRLADAAPAGESGEASLAQIDNLEDYLEEIERKLIMQALEETRWNRTAAAQRLGLTFRSMRYRLKKLGID